jgi:8-oxo-dGTP diphosphatase
MKTDLVVGGYVVNGGKVLLILHKKLSIWIPPGGHIEEDETPDDAIIREIHEELGLRIRLLNHSDLPYIGNVKKNLAIPFYVNVHSVGNHDHCCFFYVCEALNPKELSINKEEIDDYGWFSREELGTDKRIPRDVKYQASKALGFHSKRAND